MELQKARFEKAMPVWLAGEEKAYNQTLLFRETVHKSNAVLRVTGQSAYQVFVGGRFIFYGPARAAHGYHYVDEIDLTQYLQDDETVLSILSYSAGCNCFAYANMSAFLCAELIENGTVVAATGVNGFAATRYLPRVQVAPRFSLQRAFSEVYEMTGVDDQLFTRLPAPGEAHALTVQPETVYLPRAVPMGEYERAMPVKAIETGTCVLSDEMPERKWRKYEVYPREEVKTDPFLLARRLTLTPGPESDENSYTIWDFGKELTGFFEI